MQTLLAVAGKLVDLLPIVRDHVYHPGFGGSFSMKAVAPALAPEVDYGALEIGEGGTASSVLEALLLDDTALEPAERERCARSCSSTARSTRWRWSRWWSDCAS